MRSSSLLWSFLVGATAAATAAPSTWCHAALPALAAAPFTPLGSGPLALRSVVQGDAACIQVTLSGQPSATWFALAVSPFSTMINTPPNNAVVFHVANASAALYGLHHASPDGVVFQANQSSSLHVVESSVRNDTITLTYARPLAAASALDVAIVPNTPTRLNWAVGFSDTFPDYHDLQGSTQVVFDQACDDALFTSAPPPPLALGADSPIAVQSHLVRRATALCLRVTLTNQPQATWFGLSFAPTSMMINTPTNNALVYVVANHSLATYELRHAAPDAVVLAANQSSYTVRHAAAVNGTVTYVVERSLAAALPTDVAIRLNEPTIVNWAMGTSDFPDYHDVQGSSTLVFSKDGVVVEATPAPTTTTVAPSSCDQALVATTPAVRLGTSPLSVQSVLVDGNTRACLLVTSTDATLPWFGLSFAPTTNMINSPTTNALVFNAQNTSVSVYTLHDAAPDALLYQGNQTASYRVLKVVATNATIQYLVERTVAAATPTDVAIHLNELTIVNWAVGASAFPDYHDVQGSSKLVFQPSGVVDADAPVTPLPAPTAIECSDAAFSSLSSVSLDPALSLKYLVDGSAICLQTTLTNPNATWFALSFAPSTNMINSPTNNAVVYLVQNASAHVYDLHDTAPDAVLWSPHQSAVQVVSSSAVDGVTTLTFTRPLAATAPTDVTISTTASTIVNWAFGFSATFPDYHDAQGSTSIAFGTPLKTVSSPCSKALLVATHPVQLNDGPIALQTARTGASVCILATVRDPSATWFALSIAPTRNMINTPTNNAVVFHVANSSAAIYALHQAAPDSVLYADDQTSIRVLSSAVADGSLELLFERPVAATTATDVAISTTNPTIVNWAVGHTSWPDYHNVQGSTDILFAPLAPNAMLPAAVASPFVPTTTTVVPTYTAFIAAATFAAMALLGLVATYAGDHTFRFVNHQRLLSPPRHSGPLADLVQTLADVKVGELVIVGLYGVCLVAVAASVVVQFPGATSSRLGALVSGHLSLTSLLFILLPVARGAHWELLFGIAHDRLIKYHRWLGRLFVLTAAIHLSLNVQLATYAKSFGSQQVVPLYGFLALIAFASMAILAYERIRRQYFELFYYYHRVASIAGLALVLIHSQTVRFAMVAPLVVYGLTLLARSRAFFIKYHAQITSHHAHTVVFTLPVTAQTKQWAATMNPCAFFWVNIPSVSLLQWHPFSAIVTPDGQSIAFCIKSLSRGSFADQVVTQASANLVSMTLFVGGPYGKPAVNFTAYDEVILISGGIGVTPMLSLVNQLPHTLPHASDAASVVQTTFSSSIHIQFHWVVRTPQELLTVESLMFAVPFAPIVSPTFYVDGMNGTGGTINSNVRQTAVEYVAGRPNLDKILEPTAYVGKRVCVLVCGPPGLARSVQACAHDAGFDFHKEVFEY
ncbi:Aste57867_10252 [Aphanomyces stellatus]|uniref:Aste57867_10252 protein n=1 Tax=Aphanomyces stellatus TaxID=120398 RepID=A0A485KPW0_9STRA|nr:hypothetical protein As57867_010213 [Aphanomyces stellatus]VFT87127.1 Aste57867_10252 [Aphanomyces stellatus]